MIRVTSPADGSFVGEVPVYAKDEVEAAVTRAREAQKQWAALSFRQRGAMLKRFRDKLLDVKEEIALTVSGETGKPEAEVYSVELFYVCDAIGFWSKHARADEAISYDQEKT